MRPRLSSLKESLLSIPATTGAATTKGHTIDNQDILQRIQVLVQEEHELRDQPQDPGAGEDQQNRGARLKKVEDDLDQCWDLLRQRRAKADAGENPADADARPISQVKGYRQ